MLSFAEIPALTTDDNPSSTACIKKRLMKKKITSPPPHIHHLKKEPQTMKKAIYNRNSLVYEFTLAGVRSTQCFWYK
jgi:hypothetical protein